MPYASVPVRPIVLAELKREPISEIPIQRNTYQRKHQAQPFLKLIGSVVDEPKRK